MSDKLQDTISVGCAVKLFCTTLEEREEYKIVKSRDTVEYKPQFGSKMKFGSKLYYDTVTKFAEYADDELVEDCPLAKTLIGKKLGDSFKINDYTYKVESITFPDGRVVEVKAAPVETPKPAVKNYPRYSIDWDSGFATECSKEELDIIRNFEAFLKEEFPQFLGDSKINRIAFCDPNIQLDGVQYSQFWFIKRGGVLTFRFKLNQNDKEDYKHCDNVLVADSVQLNSIKILVRLILSAQKTVA